MTAEEETLPLIERKVVRRGLIAGLAGLGAAAMIKLTGANKAAAVDGVPIIIGDEAQTAQTPTLLTASPATPGPAINGAMLQIVNGGSAWADFSAITGSGGAGRPGVIGISDTSYGVYGRSTSATNPSVLGLQLGSGPGIRGVAANNGIGIKGVSNTGGFAVPDGDGSGTGVHGKTGSGVGVRGDSSTGIGVRGACQGGIGVLGVSDFAPGMEGSSFSSLGVRGLSTHSVAIVGISTNNHGLYGSTSNAGSAGFVGENLAGGLAGYFAGNVFITGSLQVAGPKNAVIKMQDGTNASVYCQESPEPFFEDFGRAQLVAGVANVQLERDFATLVAGGDYMVFCFPEGPSGGLYVSRRGATSFEVRDPANGSISFTYRIVTRRKDIEGKRFARVTDEVGATLAASRAAVRVGGTPPSQPSSQNPVTPPPFVPDPPAPAPGPIQPMPTAPNNPVAPGPIQTNPDQPGLIGPR